VIKVGGSSLPTEDVIPTWIYLENLDIRSARASYTFTDDAGKQQTYNKNAAAVHLEVGEHITVRGCQMHDADYPRRSRARRGSSTPGRRGRRSDALSTMPERGTCRLKRISPFAQWLPPDSSPELLFHQQRRTTDLTDAQGAVGREQEEDEDVRAVRTLRQRLEPDQPVNIMLWTVNTHVAPIQDIHLKVGAPEPIPEGGWDLLHSDPEGSLSVWEVWQRTLQQSWHQEIELRLRKLQALLAEDVRTRQVIFYGGRTLSVSLLAGVLFHHGTSFDVACQTLEGVWSIHRQKLRTSVPIREDRRVMLEGNAWEVHVLIATSRAVENEYRGWLSRGHERAARRCIHIDPESGPNRQSVDEELLFDWAETLFERMTAAQEGLLQEERKRLQTERERLEKAGQSSPTASPPLKKPAVRLFFATSTALAMAPGRSLNAVGEVIVMDHQKLRQDYYEAFRLTI